MPPCPATSVAAAPIPGSVTLSRPRQRKRHEPYVLIDDSDLSLSTRRRFLTGGALLIGFMFTNRAWAVAPEPDLQRSAPWTPRPPAFAALCLTALSGSAAMTGSFSWCRVSRWAKAFTPARRVMIAEELEVGPRSG
jgi:hypothetical protein